MAIRSEDLYRISREDYLEGEVVASEKSEWVDGVVYAMAGATRLHGETLARISRLLYDSAQSLACSLVTSDLLVETDGAYYYPDVVVSCQPPDDPRIERKPCFIAEVVSPSTKRVDREEKRSAYCELPSLRDYWIVDAEHKVIEIWTLAEQGWVGEHRAAGDPIRVDCLDLELRVVDVVGR